MKVLTLIGTRPEAIKMAPVLRELERYDSQIKSVICATGQHREMLDQVFEIFNIRPNYRLGTMRPGQSLSQLTARMLIVLDEVLKCERPDWVLVQGDTTTVLAGALAAFYNRIQVGHVEAGLRTGDKFRPFPEEINRRLADNLSDLHFVPTASNRANLLAEGVLCEKIVITGNTVIDALMLIVESARSEAHDKWSATIEERRLLLVTAHRRESFGRPLEEICRALSRIAQDYSSDVHIIYPVHLNPNVWKTVHATLGGIPNISLLKPLGYREFVGLMDLSYLVLTDSGGLQEEAPALGKPVLLLRDETERPEGLISGTVELVGSSFDQIVSKTAGLLDDEKLYKKMSRAISPYGDGRASERIVAALMNEPYEPFTPDLSLRS